MHFNLSIKRIISIGIIFAILGNAVIPSPAWAQLVSPLVGEFNLPAPGVMAHLSPQFNPPILKGIKVYPDDPFRFDFIVDGGDGLSLDPRPLPLDRGRGNILYDSYTIFL